MNACWYGTFNKEFDSIEKHWNSKKNIVKHIGKIGGNTVDKVRTSDYLNDVSEHLFQIPFNSDFNFTEGMVNRMKHEINKIESNYKSKNISGIKKYFYVPDAIANYSPVTRVFYENVNFAINYERNNLDMYLSYSRSVSKHIQNALIGKGMTGGEAKEYKKKMAKLEKEILTAGNQDDLNSYLREYTELFDSNGGEVINDYIALMSMKKSDYAKESGKYGKDVRLAVEESRELLDSMGKVMITGFNRMENVVKLIASNPILSRLDKNYLDKIKAAKERIQKGIEQGGYLPHILLDNIIEISVKTKQMMDGSLGKDKVENAGMELLDKINELSLMPNQAKSKNDLLNNIWSKNPFYILQQYSKDAIAFNKINFIQESYLPAMRRFQKEDVNPNFIKSMRQFIDDTYTISTKGLLERPNWVNATVRSLMAVETLKAMGLSVTGAIRNGASAAYFFTKNGVLSASRAVSKYNSHYSGRIAAIEKEQGFVFGEAGRELVAEGLIPSSVNQSDIVYNPIENKVTYRDRGVLKVLDPLVDKAVGGSLVFHRFTENATRKWMFRIAWIESFEALKGHNILDPHKNYKDFAAANDGAIEKMATRFALKAVNAFAFEYAPHAKARGIGGTAPQGELGPNGLPKMKARDYTTAVGELAFQFLHYPMSFLNLQSKVAVGAKDAYLSGQYDAPEIKQALRFAGIYLAVGTLSGVADLDFTNTLENDTVERLIDIRDYFIRDPKELEGRKRGLLNDFTGPIVGDILYGLNLFQVMKMPDEEWQKMILGYIDYYDEGHVPDWADWKGHPRKRLDTEEKTHMWNKMNVELGRWRTKNIPAIRDGRGFDIFRHELGWYPRKQYVFRGGDKFSISGSTAKEKRKWVNKYADKWTGYRPFKEGRTKRGKPTTQENLLKLMKEFERRNR